MPLELDSPPPRIDLTVHPQQASCIDVDECADCVKSITHSKLCTILMLYPSFIGAILAVVLGSIDWNRHSGAADKKMLWSYYVFVIGNSVILGISLCFGIGFLLSSFFLCIIRAFSQTESTKYQQDQDLQDGNDTTTLYFRSFEYLSSVIFIVSIVISGLFLGATQCFSNTCVPAYEGCPVYCTSSDASYVVAWTNLVTSVIVLFNLCLK